jgi:general stress protein YciG
MSGSFSPLPVQDLAPSAEETAAAISTDIFTQETTMTTTKKRCGFAAMSPEKRRAIAAKGGASVAPANRSFSKDRDLAATAGRAGGEKSRGGGRRPAVNPEAANQ